MPVFSVQNIPITSLGLLPPLVNDYLKGEQVLQHLYQYPFTIEGFEQAIHNRQFSLEERSFLVDVLQRQYANLPKQDEVNNHINLLLKDNTFTVTAAHQPCLLMGPLFNIYKIAATINVCRRLSVYYPRYNFVPVFWMGSEDHDADELAHTYVYGKRLDWNIQSAGPFGRNKTESLKQVFTELKQLLNLEFPNKFITKLEDAIDVYPTFGEYTHYIIHELFKQFGLVVINQDDKLLKKKFSAVMREEIVNLRAIKVLKPALDYLEQNYKVQANPREINFFYLTDNGRERIVYNADAKKYEVLNTSVSFTENELLNEIHYNPENFSPNVIYRPLYQEMTLPNLAFIGGAGETSYWLELKALFEHYRVNYPVLVQRTSAVILSASNAKKLDKLGLTPADMFSDLEQLIKDYIKKAGGDEVNLTAEKAEIEKLFADVINKAEAVDPTLKQAAAGEKQKLINSLEGLEGKMIKALKRKEETTVTQIRTAYAAMFPNGTPQERQENFITYYLKYGPAFIGEVVDNMVCFDKNYKVFIEG